MVGAASNCHTIEQALSAFKSWTEIKLGLEGIDFEKKVTDLHPLNLKNLLLDK